jgi:hypothetical protein
MTERDWATEEAVQLVDVIRRSKSTNMPDVIEYVAAKLRVIKQAGHGEGLDAASKAMDEVFSSPTRAGA